MNVKFLLRTLLVIVSATALGALAGCSGGDAPINLDQEIVVRDQRISELEESARQAQAQLEMSQREAAEAARRATDAEAMAKAKPATTGPAELLPPNATAGECYARVLVPPVYETTSEKMLVKDASSTITVVPAKFEWVEEKVLLKEAGEKLVVVPATYKTVSEEILVKPASTEMVEVPAVYETATEEVLVTPAREYWKRGRGPIEKVDGATGEIMCLVKEPAVYKTVTRKVLKSEATTREQTIPAEYKTITRTVIDKPASTRTEVIPAEYGSVKVRKLVSPAREMRNPVEAEYRTVSKQTMVRPSYMEWRQVLCETNMTNTTIRDIQTALKAKGFDPGPIDGVYGSQTQAAVNAFQDSRQMARGALTYKTIEALGLKF